MRTAVSIPDPLFQAVDELAERLGVSRSRLYTVALERFVRSHDDAVTMKLNEVYATEPSSLEPALQRIQARSIPRDGAVRSPVPRRLAGAELL